MTNKLALFLFGISLTLLLTACGGGGGGSPAPSPTTAKLTLSIQAEPSLLGALVVDIPLPAGVGPAVLGPEGVTGTFDVTGSTTILGTIGTSYFQQVTTFTVSTNTLQVVIFTLDPDVTHRLGTGSYAQINCSLASGAPAFPATATVVSATDVNLNDILNPANSITVPIGVVLQ